MRAIKEYLQAHTFSWLHNDTLQYNYRSGKQCEVYIYYRGRNIMIYNIGVNSVIDINSIDPLAMSLSRSLGVYSP